MSDSLVNLIIILFKNWWLYRLYFSQQLHIPYMPKEGFQLYTKQDRSKPRGPAGLFQPIVDAVKLLLKEDIVPNANRFIHSLAPSISIIVSLSTFAVIPFRRYHHKSGIKSLNFRLLMWISEYFIFLQMTSLVFTEWLSADGHQIINIHF